MTDSFGLVEEALKMSKVYIQKDLEEEELEELDDKDNRIEEEMVNAYFELNEERRQQIQRKIPLKILRRLKMKKNSHSRTIQYEDVL